MQSAQGSFASSAKARYVQPQTELCIAFHEDVGLIAESSRIVAYTFLLTCTDCTVLLEGHFSIHPSGVPLGIPHEPVSQSCKPLEDHWEEEVQRSDLRKLLHRHGGFLRPLNRRFSAIRWQERRHLVRMV
jgi:hypothetical protein